MHSPDDIADALTGAQAREAVRGFLHAVNHLDQTANVTAFHERVLEAVDFTERLALEAST